MAKRFTDSTKWNKPFIRAMKAPYKLLWLYILDECDHAGIWQVDFEVAQVKIGEKLNIDIALQQLSGKIYPFDNGEKWFIPDFIDFQYGVLNPENRAHNSVIMLLNKYNLSLHIKPLTSPLQGAMDKDKDIDKANSINNRGLSLDDFRALIDEALSKCIFTDRFTETAISQFKDWAKTQNKVDALRKIKSDMPVYLQGDIDYLSKKYTHNQIEYITEISARRMYVGLFEKEVPPPAPIKKQQFEERYSDPQPVKPTEPIEFVIPNEFK